MLNIMLYNMTLWKLAFMTTLCTSYKWYKKNAITMSTLDS